VTTVTSDAASAATVRLSSLCSRPVHDAEGKERGTVLDVLVTRDGPTNVSGDAPLQIAGLIVGPAGWTERLGLFRSKVHGPWLLRWIARLVGPERCYLRWDQVIDPHHLAEGGEVRYLGDLHAMPDV
jgi:hypothetical protein